MKNIAIIGECMIELTGQPFGSMIQTFGGDTLNAAFYLSRTASKDIKVHYVSAMGTDALSEGMIKRWQDEGIETEFVLRDKQRTAGLYLIQVDNQGERTFLYWRNQSAAKYMLQHAGFSKIKESLKGMDMVFLSGISLAILEPQDREQLIILLTELASAGIEIVFDSNHRPALWPDDKNQTAQQAHKKILEICSIALLTFDDEQIIWGDANHQDTLNRLYKIGTKKVVLKLGSSGCVYSDFSQTHEASPVTTEKVKNVVDTTSAGDSFNGGFLSAYLEGADIHTACERGNKLAGIVIQHRGAIICKQASDKIFN